MSCPAAAAGGKTFTFFLAATGARIPLQRQHAGGGMKNNLGLWCRVQRRSNHAAIETCSCLWGAQFQLKTHFAPSTTSPNDTRQTRRPPLQPAAVASRNAALVKIYTVPQIIEHWSLTVFDRCRRRYRLTFSLDLRRLVFQLVSARGDSLFSAYVHTCSLGRS